MRLAVVLLALVATACTKTGPQQCPSLERPSARSQVQAVLLPTTNQIYALGGQGPHLPIDELWRYSFGACGGWSRLVLASSPGPRAGYAAALDDMRHRIVYIGGGTTNDVWTLDTDNLTFTKLATVATPPVVAAAELAAYDATHDRVIYAGIETYELDFAASDQGNWQFVDKFSLQAPAYGAVDPTRSMLVALDAVGMHGFSLLSGTWHDIAMTGDVPPTGAELAWDDGGKDLLVIADGVFVGELGANGNSIAFTALVTTNNPPPRSSFAYAVSGNTAWVAGGLDANGCTLDDLWTLDLDTHAWTNVWPATTCM